MQIAKRSATVLACLASAVACPLPPGKDAFAQPVLPSAAEYSGQLLPQLDGTVPWHTLAALEFVRTGSGGYAPRFSDAVLRLDNKDVQIHGFMLPLNMGADQKYFLISAVPPDCKFCMPAGPEGVVEVLSGKPLAYSPDPILIRGKFSVLKDDARGILYRMSDAERLPAR